MRVTAVFNRLLGFAGTAVESVSFSGRSVLVGVRLRAKVLVCPCGRRSRAAYDRSRRRWRHTDFGRWRVIVQAGIRRLDCRVCGVRTEVVPWARPNARHTTGFEDLVVWLARRMAKSSVATFLGTTWHTVDAIVRRAVAAHGGDCRFDDLRHIGIDEIAYKKGRKFLTVIADHRTGKVIWIAEGRSMAIVGDFLAMLGPRRAARIKAVTMDMGHIYREAVRAAIPKATICFDPFHVIKWAGEALDQTHLAQPRQPLHIKGLNPARAWQKVRATLRAAKENLDRTARQILAHLKTAQPALYQAWQLKEQLRRLYRLPDPTHAARFLKRWCTKAQQSGLSTFATLARRIGHHFDGIIASVHMRLSNSLVEGLNAGIRLIQRRAHGYTNLNNLIDMIYLCHGPIPAHPPHQPTGTD